MNTIQTITPDDLAARMAADDAPMLIDVREPEECAASGVIAGATNVPLTQLVSGVVPLPSFASDVTVVAICRSGARSTIVARELAAAGMIVANLAGGMMAWVAAGLPVAPFRV